MTYDEWKRQSEALIAKPTTRIQRPLTYQQWKIQAKVSGFQPVFEKDPWYEAFGKELGKGILRGFLNVGKGVVGTTEAIIPGKQEFLLGAKGRIQEAARAIPVTHEGTAAFAGQIIGEAIPYMGAAIAGGYVGGPIGAALVGFSVEGDDAYDRAKAAGASEGEAQFERLVVGSINAGLEALQINRLMKFHKTGKYSLRGFINLIRDKAYKKAIQEGAGFSAEVLATSIAEGLEEAAQEGVSIAVPAIFRHDVPRTPTGKVDWNAVVKQIGMAGLAGGLVGGVFAISGAAIKEVAGTRVITEAEQARLEEIKKETEALDPTTQKFITLMALRKRKTGRERRRIAELRRKERGKRIGRALEELTAGPEEWRYYSALKELKGELPAGFFDPLSEDLTIDEIEFLRQKIRTNEELLGFERINTEEALNKVLIGELPTPSEVRLLEKQFGSLFAAQLLKHRPLKSQAYEALIEALNLPRTLMASCDLSNPLRQGVMWAVRHPKIWGRSAAVGYKILFGNKYFWQNPEKYAAAINAAIKTNPYYKKASQYLDFIETGTDAAARAEEFMSHWAEKIPDIGKLVTRSELAFVTTQNKRMMDLFAYYANEWEKAGYKATEEDYKLLGHLINITNGRGDIRFLRKHAPLLNALFFSPRFVASKIQVLTMLARSVIPGQMSWAIRKILWADVASFVLAGIGLLSLLSMHPDIEVEDDPRSSDFGKARLEDTRIDIWGGYSPLARLVVQLWTGQRKATDTGEIYDINQSEVLLRFIRSKLSPLAGMTYDLATGTTYEGEEIKAEPAVIGELLYNNLIPLAAQDIIDAGYYSGFYNALLVAPLVFQGVGGQTYPMTLSKKTTIIKNQIAQSVLGRNWDELGPDVQKILREARPRIKVIEAQARAESTYKYNLNRIKEEQEETAARVFNSLPEFVRAELQRNYIVMPGLSRRYGDWFLNDERYEEYINLTSKYLNIILPKLVRNPRYQRLDILSKSAIVQDAISRCKKMAREQIAAKATASDLLSLRERLNIGKTIIE